jgi:hypothetical protein
MREKSSQLTCLRDDCEKKGSARANQSGQREKMRRKKEETNMGREEFILDMRMGC